MSNCAKKKSCPFLVLDLDIAARHARRLKIQAIGTTHVKTGRLHGCRLPSTTGGRGSGGVGTILGG